WVLATVPIAKLQWLSFPNGNSEKGASVRIENSSAWAHDAFRKGYLDKQIGALDDKTRLARVLVKVADPLATKKELKGKPKLMIGTFVEVKIQADSIADVVRISRDHIRNNETVWVMKEKKLEIRKVTIDLTDDTHAYISEGLEDDEKVVVTDLSTVSNGIELRTSDDASETEME
ncbi:MAG: efflux transporter periplasmic adaptor subunit, partial [Maribacter litoralis]|uniref:efflux RND transporter periplasmic adaptor subunit n=1 Tax=Maribacter litoralis TaxID=2059726 RepID=UPI00329AA858